MIIDEFKNLEMYAPVLKKLRNGLECISKIKDWTPAKYEFEGGFLMVQKGTTKPVDEKDFENHEKFIDVQYMIEGGEEMVYTNIKNLVPEIPYDGQNDIAFFKGAEGKVIKIVPGMCYVVFPEDGHMPCRHTNTPYNYTKIVMKLPVK